MAIALLPSISELFSRGERQAFQQTINGSIRIILSLTIPSAVLLGVGLRPLVSAAFPAFDSQGIEMVVSATRVFLIGLAGHALLEIAARSFYAQQNARVPLYAAALNSGVYIMLAVTLSRTLGHVGIAWANTIAFTLEAVVLLWLLNRSYPGLLDDVRNTLMRVGFVSLMTGLGLYALLGAAPSSPVFVSLGGMLGGLVIVVFSIRPELRFFMSMGERAGENS